MHTFLSFLFLLSILLPSHDAQEATTSERIVTAHPLATAAGAKVLEEGGTAVDAMIAVQTVLGLVEPQSSGIGGGAFCVYYNAATDQLTTFDARETAPAAATEGRFQDEEGTSVNFLVAWNSGLSVGVPGVPRLMEVMHQKYGTLEWADLFTEAKTLATDGFPVSQRIEDSAAGLLLFNPLCEVRSFFRDPEAFEYFLNEEDCTPKPAGTMLTNPAYAATIQLLADEGADGFYMGPLAERMVAKIANDVNPTGDPTLTMEDFLNYKVVEREPVCQLYRDTYNVCGMGPPSSGGLALGQIFGILNNFALSDNDVQDVSTVHLFTQAMRLAFADRGLYVGDSDFVTVPIQGMLDADYLAARANLINITSDMGTATAGDILNAARSPQTTDDEGGTSHFSIVDQYGNALSMTTTVESVFGNGLMVDGFLLNNQLTDFSFAAAGPDGQPIANRVQGSKRPRSSMSPTIVLDKDTNAVTHLTGSPGGSRIIGYTAHSLLSMIDFGFDPQAAVGIPSFQNRNGNTELEANKPNITTLEYDFDAMSAALEAMGHVVVPTGGGTSGLSVIQVTADGTFLGGADPRRDGAVAGRDASGGTWQDNQLLWWWIALAAGILVV